MRSFLPAVVRMLPVVLVGYLVFSAIRGFLFERYIVPSSSMEPTLHGDPRDGDLVLVDKTAYWRHDPEPWELLVVRFREQAGEQFLVKRMVARGPLFLSIDRGDLFTGMTGNALRRVVKDPASARPLRQTWNEFPGASPAATFLLPGVGLWRVDGERILLGPGAATLDALVELTRPERRRERLHGAEPDLHLPQHLGTRESVSMTFLDCHGQRRGRAFEDQDVGYELTIVPAAGVAGMHFVLEYERQYHGIAWSADGQGKLHSGGVASGIALHGPKLEPGRLVQIEFGYLDGHLFLILDGQLVAHAAQELQPAEFETEVPGRMLPRLPSLLHVGAAGAAVEIRRLRVFHDIYYDRAGNPLGGPAEAIRLEAGQIFLLGDNTAESRDSRSLGPFARPDLVGRPLAVLAPLSRLRLLLP